MADQSAFAPLDAIKAPPLSESDRRAMAALHAERRLNRTQTVYLGRADDPTPEEWEMPEWAARRLWAARNWSQARKRAWLEEHGTRAATAPTEPHTPADCACDECAWDRARRATVGDQALNERTYDGLVDRRPAPARSGWIGAALLFGALVLSALLWVLR